MMLLQEDSVDAFVDLLLLANADPKAETNYGKTPRQWAEIYGHKDIAARLLKAEQAAVAT